MKIGLIVIGVLVLSVLCVFGWAAGSRNTLVTEREAVNAAWSQVDVALQRRDIVTERADVVAALGRSAHSDCFSSGRTFGPPRRYASTSRCVSIW